MRRISAFLLVCVMMTRQATAAVLFIAAGDSPLYQGFLVSQQHLAPSTSLQEITWQGATLRGLIVVDKGDTAQTTGPTRINASLIELCRRAAVVVAVGGQAVQAATQECQRPTLVVLTPYAELKPLLKQGASVSAIYQEADPVLNLRLLHELIPKAIRVGILVSPGNQERLPRLREEAQRLQLRLEEINVATDEDAVRQLRLKIEALDALLLLPDTTVVNEWSLKPILLMAARRYLPIVGGLSEQYVQAGVLAAVVPDIKGLPEQIQDAVEQLSHGRVPPPAYPHATQVVVNQTVARALSIRTDSLDK